MMLTFYGLYKQATEGPCQSPKPSFWDLIKKAKWYNSLILFVKAFEIGKIAGVALANDRLLV